MSGNRGTTTMKRRRRHADPMQAYDRLPAPLRGWIANAALPWAPRSVLRTYRRVLTRCRDRDAALSELDRIEARLMTRDAQRRKASETSAPRA